MFSQKQRRWLLSKDSLLVSVWLNQFHLQFTNLEVLWILSQLNCFKSLQLYRMNFLLHIVHWFCWFFLEQHQLFLLFAVLVLELMMLLCFNLSQDCSIFNKQRWKQSLEIAISCAMAFLPFLLPFWTTYDINEINIQNHFRMSIHWHFKKNIYIQAVDISLWNTHIFICLCFFAMNEFNDVLQQRRDYEENVRNHNSYINRFYIIRNFWKYLVSIKPQFKLEEIELYEIIQYLVYYRTHKNCRWTIPSRCAEYNVICAIRCFFKFCNMIWMKMRFNREQIPMFKQEPVKREPMSEEDYQLMHTAIRLFSKSEEIRLRDELMIEIPRETWLRKSEIVRCKFKDFHNENRQFKVLVKWNRYESVFFSEKLQKKVFEYEKILNQKYKHLDIEKLFVCLWQKEKWKEISSHLLWKHFLLIVKRMKKEWMIPKNKTLCLHQERHSFAMRCVYSWLSQQATTRLMRHTDPKITLHYYHLNDSRLLEQYDSIRV